MKKPAYPVTRHARDRSSSRLIPEMAAEIIIDFGESEDAGDCAHKYALTKASMRELRRAAGRAIANALSPYRSRHAYFVAAGGRVITVAYSSHPLFD